MLKNKSLWQPSAELALLKQRAMIFAKIRSFFAERDVLEVDTPVMCHASVTDPYIASISVNYQAIGSSDFKTLYLQTSPEYAMKRLLAAGSGDIYQITKAFRQGEVGRLHNPEFMMLEWYRIDFDHHQLMNEMDALLQTILQTFPAIRLSYGKAFLQWVGIDPHTATLEELALAAEKHQIVWPKDETQRNVWLDLLFTHVVEVNLAKDCPTFIYDFPISQAALAKIRPENPPVASRFEVYYKGIELANGFHELQDAVEQQRRFERDLVSRKELGKAVMPVDQHFLNALTAGLPHCSGVALGVDRLIMLSLGCEDIKEILSFNFERA